MTALLLLTWLLGAPQQPRPLTVHTYAVQCIPVREVVCYLDANFTLQQCLNTVPAGIDALNKAAGREVLRFDGFVAKQDVGAAFEQGMLVILGDKLNTKKAFKSGHYTLGSTHPKVAETDKTFCIERVFIAIDVNVWTNLEPPAQAGVVLHELGHAIGLAHAEGAGYGSFMSPAINNKNAQDRLSESDAAAIRFVYGPR